MSFQDRFDAGRQLGRRLAHLRGTDVVVVGLPRGGVPVAFEVARALDAPLDVLVVRKLGVPLDPELAMGAIGEGGVRVLNERVLRLARVSHRAVARVERRERAELERRVDRFRRGRPPLPLADKTVIVVDDGIATGATMRAACEVARARRAARVVVATAVAAPGALAAVSAAADDVVCLETPMDFDAVGQAYRDFAATTDDEVTDLLRRAGEPARGAERLAEGSDRRPVRSDDVEIPAGPLVLPGRLSVPTPCVGTVVFAHGSGSSRHSPRNRLVAERLNEARLATLLFDLLTLDEASHHDRVFDVPLLAERLTDTLSWTLSQPATSGLPLGIFGASTGAAAAIWAASQRPSEVQAIVCRGGRPDLALPRLRKLTAPTLLIVGGRDDAVLGLNRLAQTQMRCANELAVIPGATHLFEEPGALDEVAARATEWFCDHFDRSRP